MDDPDVIMVSSTEVRPELDPKERVELKERTVEVALQHLRSIRDKLQSGDILAGEFDVKGWGSSLDEITRDHEKFEFLTGVAGDTGMGKTSLLNTLVHEAGDIAPSSQNGACTAAVCCFQYHSPPDPAQRFKAVVQYRSRDSVEAELNTLFQDHRDLEADAEIEGSDSTVSDERDRIQDQLKIVRGWSGFSIEELKHFGSEDHVSAITSTCKKSSEFFNNDKPAHSNIIHISKPTPEAFLKEVRPYVGSTGPSSKQVLRWPLVERVRVYLPSPFLKTCPGLVLVDLPGEMDANEARSEVAKSFYGQLDRLMVVTPSDRASDNKTASDLIREDQICDIEADGKADNDFLAVVISKVDQLKWKRFVKDEVDPAEISESFPKQYQSLMDKEEELKVITMEIRNVKGQLGDLEREGEDVSYIEVSSVGSKRSHRSVVPDRSSPSLLHGLQKQHTELCSLRNTLNRDIQDLESKCFRACIDYRSHDSIQKFQEHFDGVRNRFRKKEKAKTHITVLPVSSMAQSQLARGEPMQGFPDSDATGFIKLKEWIAEGSLPKREAHSDGVFHRCLVLFDAIEGWLNDDWLVSSKLPSSELTRIIDVLQDGKQQLRSEMTKTENRFSSWLRRQAPFDAKQKKPIVGQLLGGFQGTIEGWSKSRQRSAENRSPYLHWSTYDACIRRHGGLFKTHRRPRVVHDWQSRLYGFYWSRFAEDWGETFSKRLPAYALKRTVSVNRAFLSAHEQTITKEERLPKEYREAFSKSAYRIESYARAYRSNIHSIVASLRETSRVIRHGSRPVLKESMAAAFSQAAGITGSKKQARQMKVLRDFAVDNATMVIKDSVGKDIDKKLSDLRSKVAKDIKGMHDDLCKQVFTIEKDIARQVCSSATEKKSNRDPALKSVRTSLSQDLDEWKKFWDEIKQDIPEICINVSLDDEDDLDREDEGFEDSHAENSSLARKGKGTSGAKETEATKDKPRKKAAVSKPRGKPGPKPKNSKALAAPKAVAKKRATKLLPLDTAGVKVEPNEDSSGFDL